MARPGSEKQSLVGTGLTQALECALSGTGNRTGKVASAALAWMPSGTMPRSAAFPVLVNQQPSAAQGLFHRNRIINAIGITTLSLRSWPFDRRRDHKKSIAVAAEEFR